MIYRAQGDRFFLADLHAFQASFAEVWIIYAGMLMKGQFNLSYYAIGT
jgi:hypothetical protein